MARAAENMIREIREEIHTGVLRPGDQLEEAALAERFGVSRTPVREAVRSLVEQGLLETKPRKGAIVRIPSANELIDLFEVAAELEGMASRLAAERLTNQSAQKIEAALDQCRHASETDDNVAYSAANLAFHQAILDAAGNQCLAEQITLLTRQTNAYRAMPFEVRGRISVSYKEHRDIMLAIFDNNGVSADQLTRGHMMLQGKRVPMLLRNLALND